MRDFMPSDLSEVNSWCRARGIAELSLDAIPKNGLFEPMTGVGWLYLTDSSIAFIDGFVSNPGMESRLRGVAMASIGEGLLEKAKALRVRHVIVTTQHANIARWALEHGFAQHGLHSMLTKEV